MHASFETATLFDANEAIELVPIVQGPKVDAWVVRVEDGKQARGAKIFHDLERAVFALGATIERYPFAKVTMRKVR